MQCSRVGLLDELWIHLAPVLLGDGIRLFEGREATHLFDAVIDRLPR